MRRNPIRSETDAFRLTVAGAAIMMIAVLVGWLTQPLVGVVVFVMLALAALALHMSRPESDRRRPLRDAAREPHPHGAPSSTRHLLIVANEQLDGHELRNRILGDNGQRVEIDVLAPVLSSRTHLAYTDIDSELRDARRRLARSLQWARAQGFLARGEVGDPSPTTAIEDELRDFGPDEVIVVTARRADARWQEQTELERLRDELHVPVTQIATERSTSEPQADGFTVSRRR